MWILFRVPCPTPDGRTAEEVHGRRLNWITPQMPAGAIAHGCRFRRAWHTADGAEFAALAKWDSPEGVRASFAEWSIDSEPGEVSVELLGDVGLVLEP